MTQDNEPKDWQKGQDPDSVLDTLESMHGKEAMAAMMKSVNDSAEHFFQSRLKKGRSESEAADATLYMLGSWLQSVASAWTKRELGKMEQERRDKTGATIQ